MFTPPFAKGFRVFPGILTKKEKIIAPVSLTYFILLESGYYLLFETGDKIIKEIPFYLLLETGNSLLLETGNRLIT